MGYLVLARKYRPQTFAEVVGQEHVVRTLKNAISHNRLAHALLFSGIRGVGKTTIARILAKALNCEKGPAEEPCNECSACREITEGRAVDVQEIDAASNRGIDEIRELRENVKFPPSRLRTKVYIIDEAHMLTREAFNALLKTLEEPPPHVYFILATTEAQRIPITILSRCQRYDFKRLPLQRLLVHLKDICKKEGVQIHEDALLLLAREAEGSVRDALSLLDQAISSGIKTQEDLIQTFGLADRMLVEDLARAVLAQDLARSFHVIDQAFEQGVDLTYLVQGLTEFFRHLLAIKVSPTGTLDDLPEGELSTLRALSLDSSPEMLVLLFQIFLKALETLRLSQFPKLSLELTVAKACEIGKIVSLEEILEKVTELQKKIGNLPSKAPREAEETTNIALQDQLTWKNFVAEVKKRKPALGSLLDTMAQPRVEKGLLVLEIPQNSLLTAKEYQEDLKSLARELLHQELKFQITAPRENTSVRQKLLEKPIVQEALKVLGGKISEIKVHNQTQEDLPCKTCKV